MKNAFYTSKNIELFRVEARRSEGLLSSLLSQNIFYSVTVGNCLYNTTSKKDSEI
jgi:hypothetical protein